MKYVMILVACLMLSGCGTSGHPVPPEAFASCLEKGGNPVYNSNTSRTTFECDMDKGREKR